MPRAKRSSASDGLQSFVANIGTDRDKVASMGFVFNTIVSVEEADAIYRSTWLGRKIVDIPPADMTRRWRVWRAKDSDVSRIEADEERLGLAAKVHEATVKARLHGGAAIVLGLPGDPDKPPPLKAGPGTIAYAHVVDREQLTPSQLDSDLASANFGRPSTWRYASTHANQIELHWERVVLFRGRPVPRIRGQEDFLGDGLFQAVRDALVNASLASHALAALMTEAKVDVVKVPDLMVHLSKADGEQRLRQRFALAATLKSINNMLLLGGDETYEQKQPTFTGLSDVHARLLQEVSGAADIPLTRLLGQSPAGMNATGDSDMRNYYDGLAGERARVIDPALKHIDRFLVPSGDIWWEWPPLWEPTEREKAEIASTRATAFATIANTGVLPEPVLQAALVSRLSEDGTYPGLDEAMEAFGLDTDETAGTEPPSDTTDTA